MILNKICNKISSLLNFRRMDDMNIIFTLNIMARNIRNLLLYDKTINELYNKFMFNDSSDEFRISICKYENSNNYCIIIDGGDAKKSLKLDFSYNDILIQPIEILENSAETALKIMLADIIDLSNEKTNYDALDNINKLEICRDMINNDAANNNEVYLLCFTLRIIESVKHNKGQWKTGIMNEYLYKTINELTNNLHNIDYIINKKKEARDEIDRLIVTAQNNYRIIEKKEFDGTLIF